MYLVHRYFYEPYRGKKKLKSATSRLILLHSLLLLCFMKKGYIFSTLRGVDDNRVFMFR